VRRAFQRARPRSLPTAHPRWLVAGLAATMLAAAAVAGTTASADTGICGATGVLSGSGPLTCTYTTVGSDTFTVPDGVTQADVVVVGGSGGSYFIFGDAAHPPPAGNITGRPGGAGGQATATLSLTPGETLQIDVAARGIDGTAASRSGGMMNGPSGGAGALGGFGGSNRGVPGGPGDAGGANGGTAFNGGNGSGGGGSSDVRGSDADCAALRCGLATRLIVGAGGGGGGGTGGQGDALGGAGGDGGGADGGADVDGANRGVSGTGGMQSGGGAGGLNAGRHGSPAEPDDPRFGGDGADGSSGAGGAGGAGNLPCNGAHVPPCRDPNATTSGGGAGGGAGGGFFGGGGGSGGGGTFGSGRGGGGGGGGGSSFVTPDAIDSVLTTGVNADTINAGNGRITITWQAPAPSVTLSTEASVPVAIGGQISASATLEGGASPTGTIAFGVYGPDDSSCTHSLANSTATVSGNGMYTSAPYTATSPGVYRWIAAYGGDGANPTAGPTSCSEPGAQVIVGDVPAIAGLGFAQP
jgi:hypothetical protein